MELKSLFFSSFLILISVYFSISQKLKLEKEIIIGVVRAVIQLTLVGYLLDTIFGMKNPIFTLILLLIMILNAAYNASKRGKGIDNIFFITFISIAIGAITTLSILVFTGSIEFTPYEIIPIGGMIIGNSMASVGLCYKQLKWNFNDKISEIETKLALGSDTLSASRTILRDSIKTGMQPMIDSTKTLGIVSLPGMMTGLILSGTSPIIAVRYQIMVTFMILSCTSISSYICCFLAYSKFYNDRKQLIKLN